MNNVNDDIQMKTKINYLIIQDTSYIYTYRVYATKNE